MKILLALLLAVTLTGCDMTRTKQTDATPQLVFDKQFDIQIVDPTTGELVSPEPCGEKCRVFDKESVLTDSTTISVLVNEFPNPHCCYTFNYDGALSQYCWVLPPGTKCPILN
jgi:ABC-type uncharacterized transport system auxiliary subunit